MATQLRVVSSQQVKEQLLQYRSVNQCVCLTLVSVTSMSAEEAVGILSTADIAEQMHKFLDSVPMTAAVCLSDSISMTDEISILR